VMFPQAWPREAWPLSQTREPERVTILTDLLPPALRYAINLSLTAAAGAASNTGNDRGFPST
jgi:hypothetical protein